MPPLFFETTKLFPIKASVEMSQRVRKESQPWTLMTSLKAIEWMGVIHAGASVTKALKKTLKVLLKKNMAPVYVYTDVQSSVLL